MNPTKVRRDCFDLHRKADETGRIYLVCWICKGRIDPAREKWDAEHIVRKVVGGSNDPATNVFPAHKKCHGEKTPKDISENAKGKRVSEFHYGVKQSAGSLRNSRFRKKVNGEVVER